MTASSSVRIHIKVNFPIIFLLVMLVHALLLGMKELDWSKLPQISSATPSKEKTEQDRSRPLKIRDIRTVGSRESKKRDSTYLVKNDSQSKVIMKDPFAPPQKSAPQSNIVRELKKNLSFKDLAQNQTPPKVRPGERPGILPPRPKAINAISLKGHQMQQFAQGADAIALSGDPRVAPGLSNSDVLVNLEVPEGVNPDELNKYELMFYGFQRRTAIKYINSFFKRLDKFQTENPHIQFPMTDSKQIMTGRLTYDDKGNIKQIKMIRWSNVTKLQDFFEDVLKEMDTLQNPPRALWERDKEFSVFFSLVING